MNRPIVRLLAAALAGFLATSAMAAALKLETPRDHLLAMRKIQCSLKDGEVATWYWNGYAYSRVPGEPDRQLFAVEGMNIRQCGPLGEPASAASGVETTAPRWSTRPRDLWLRSAL